MGSDTDAITRKLDFMRADIEEPGSSPAARLIAGHAVLLLDAAEAALKAADDWDAEASGSLLEEINEMQRECAAELREAITAALAGKDAGDERQ